MRNVSSKSDNKAEPDGLSSFIFGGSSHLVDRLKRDAFNKINSDLLFKSRPMDKVAGDEMTSSSAAKTQTASELEGERKKEDKPREQNVLKLEQNVNP